MRSQPRYTVIAGEFHVFYPDLPKSGPQPDGDTVTFKPHRRSLVEALKRFSGRAPRFNGRGMIPVRFEGIDALETHFQEMRQNLKWSKAEDLQDLVMWPKLFRRLGAYLAAGHVGLGAFDDWVRDETVDRDDSLRMPDGEAGNMHDTYNIAGDRLSLTVEPWRLTIAPDPA